MDINELKFDKEGLIPAIMQDVKSGEILMLAYMNTDSLQKSIETGYTHFWSRSRQKLWKKGETSGNTQKIKEILYDCDNDTLKIIIVQEGVACHTGNMSCFFKTLYSDGKKNGYATDAEIMNRIYNVIVDRKRNKREGSYVSSLMEKGKDKILKKIGEEASEVIIGSKNDNKEEIIWEVADLWFHSLVLLGFHDIYPEKIYNELEKRFGKKGKKTEK